MDTDARNADASELYYETTSKCPTCDTLLPGRVVGLASGVFVERSCPEHGLVRGLLCSDRAWWQRLPMFDVEPIRPRNPRKAVRGCPLDCGLCASHLQIAGTAAIEISNACNAQCPVCLADNQQTFEVTPQQVREMVARLLEGQDCVDSLALSGGEPTLHPALFQIIAEIERFPAVARIALNSNGLRIARDDAFLDELAKHPKVYVSLHHDGAGAMPLRGIAREVQELALDRLERWGIQAAPIILATRGVNDTELGSLARSLLLRPKIRSVVLSMMTFAGARGSRFPGDPTTRLTIPDAVRAIAEGSQGAIDQRDFIPLPMPNPMCAAIGYFLVDGGHIVPLIPLAPIEDVIAAIKNAHFARVDGDLEQRLRQGIDLLWAQRKRSDAEERTLSCLRDFLTQLFPTERSITDDERRAIVENRIKTIYMFQFMDAWTFDTKRLAKCSCQHLMPDGRIVSSCAYYSHHRAADPRFATAT